MSNTGEFNATLAKQSAVAQARNRYLRFASRGLEGADADPVEPAGEIARRVEGVATRAFSAEAPR